MKKLIYISLFLIGFLYASTCLSQDYYEDSQGEGLPLINSSYGNLLSTRINTIDNSIKINFFGNYPVIDNTIFIKNGSDTNKRIIKNSFFGFGIFIKGKAENGISNLIKTGNLQKGFNLGGYISFENFVTNSIPIYTTIDGKKQRKGWKSKTSIWKIILSGSFKFSSLKIYDPSLSLNSQLYDTCFNGYSIGLSGFYIPPIGRDNIILGFSVLTTRTNNYSILDKYEIKNMQNVIDSNGQVIRQITKDEDSYLYAFGKFKEFTKYRLRASFGYIPYFLSNRVSFIVYPSVDFQKECKPIYNLGFNVNFLHKGIPTLSDAGIFFEFSDIPNARDSKLKFLKRSLRIGLNASLNILSNEKR